MNKQELKWAAIIPLIGGMPIAMEKVTGHQPEYVMSYRYFEGNDKHYINYLRTHNWKGTYYVIDGLSKTNENEQVDSEVSRFDLSSIKECEGDLSTIQEVDVVVGVPPCAGLTSFCAHNNPEVNDWMINASKFVMENVRPKVYCFENAPRLGTEKGKPVASQIEALAEEFGYTFLIYTTESRMHGNPQIRPRSFGILYKKEYFGDSIRTLVNAEKPLGNFEDFIKAIDEEMKDKPKTGTDTLINSTEPKDDPFYAYCYEKTGATSHRDFIEKVVDKHTSTNLKQYALSHDTLDNLEAWFNEHNYPGAVKFIQRVRTKTADGKGVWMHGITAAREETPAFIGVQPWSLLHPYECRYLTLREGLALMAMPADFEIYNERPLNDSNHICQNVPVGTAYDILEEVANRVCNPSENVLEGVSYAVQRHKQKDVQIRKQAEASMAPELFED